MRTNLFSALLLVFPLALGLGGCATTLPRPVESNAALGKVVVYRNGVAYFERYAALHETYRGLYPALAPAFHRLA
jgi:hypothetical protein